MTNVLSVPLQLKEFFMKVYENSKSLKQFRLMWSKGSVHLVIRCLGQDSLGTGTRPSWLHIVSYYTDKNQTFQVLYLN